MGGCGFPVGQIGSATSTLSVAPQRLQQSGDAHRSSACGKYGIVFVQHR